MLVGFLLKGGAGHGAAESVLPGTAGRIRRPGEGEQDVGEAETENGSVREEGGSQARRKGLRPDARRRTKVGRQRARHDAEDGPEMGREVRRDSLEPPGALQAAAQEPQQALGRGGGRDPRGAQEGALRSSTCRSARRRSTVCSGSMGYSDLAGGGSTRRSVFSARSRRNGASCSRSTWTRRTSRTSPNTGRCARSSVFRSTSIPRSVRLLREGYPAWPHGT